MKLGPSQLTPEILALCKRAGVEPSRLGVEIEIKPAQRDRSLDQNARYWKIVTSLGIHLGYSSAEMHDVVLCEHFGYDQFEYGNKTITRPRKRSSKLKVGDFSELMGTAERLAAEHGVYWEAA